MAGHGEGCRGLRHAWRVRYCTAPIWSARSLISRPIRPPSIRFNRWPSLSNSNVAPSITTRLAWSDGPATDDVSSVMARICLGIRLILRFSVSRARRAFSLLPREGRISGGAVQHTQCTLTDEHTYPPASSSCYPYHGSWRPSRRAPGCSTPPRSRSDRLQASITNQPGPCSPEHDCACRQDSGSRSCVGMVLGRSAPRWIVG